jgi:beta-lactamase class A
MNEVSARAAVLSAACLFFTACSGPAPSNVQATMQAEVRASVTAATKPSLTNTPLPTRIPTLSSAQADTPPTVTPRALVGGTTTRSSVQPTPFGLSDEATPLADGSVAGQIEAILATLPGSHTTVVESLVRPVRVTVQSDEEVPSASTIKLPLMIATYWQIAAGKLSPDKQFTVKKDQVVGGTGILQGQVGRALTTTQLLETTLTYSDNTGANMLVDAIGGISVVNATMVDLGFDHTHIRRLLMDVQAQERGLENTTSAGDLADMLAQIWRGDLISGSASSDMLRILEMRGRQTDPSLDYMGRDLVPRPAIAHLNGTLDNVRNDAGIVELPDQAFIFIALLHDQPSPTRAEGAIAHATAEVARVLRSAPAAH